MSTGLLRLPARSCMLVVSIMYSFLWARRRSALSISMLRSGVACEFFDLLQEHLCCSLTDCCHYTNFLDEKQETVAGHRKNVSGLPLQSYESPWSWYWSGM
ncbi:hypothetical protein EV702DRAFT_1074133 [Suillus placidus]|uniref:Uncharacterized protein n=1 Tax=Suillus placidus TaxID=48579 RepID=A0A9P7A3L6_9AGAM|nr:hypothetical protein EV702DRAFT_1074133 [Suillus placidus]